MAATLTRFTPAHWCLLIADLADVAGVIWTYVAGVVL
jgi:hypothetical protein